MENLFVIAGLGNPGARYNTTRHNMGFRVIDCLSEKYSIKVDKNRFNAFVGDGLISGKRVLLVKPLTYMNASGEAIRDIINWYKTSLDRLLVLYDDIDLPSGIIRIRPKGSSGTHNGMKSIIFQLNSDEFSRIRIGIGQPPHGWDLADYVLSKISPEEEELLKRAVDKAAEAATAIVKSGVAKAMNLYNGIKGE